MSNIFSVFYLGKDKGFLKYSKPISAYLYFKNRRLNLLTEESEPYFILKFYDQLKEINLESQKRVVIHLMYELGEFHRVELQKEDVPLAIMIHYDHVDPWDIKQDKQHSRILFSKDKSPDFTVYKKAYQTGFQHLLKGDCYQFNLTMPATFKLSKSYSPHFLLNTFFQKKNLLSGYAHATYLPCISKLYFSNSPECLFQIGRNKPRKLWTMPIKGTLKISDKDDIKLKWKELQQSKKNESELFMITDMLRSDLNRISPPNVKVVAKKKPLLVPGILHQYSLIEKLINPKINLLQILFATFPGGSITGAPKTKVIEILKKLEVGPRGFYCGSTVLWDGFQKIWASSINIRSAEVDFKKRELEYHAGGGITLQSEINDEFLEMEAKINSFLQLIDN